MLFQRILYTSLIFSIILLTNIHNTQAADTINEFDTLKSSTISLIEQKKIQKIESSLPLISSKKKSNKDKQTQKELYVSSELADAVCGKHFHVIDYLLNLNFQTHSSLLQNYSIGCIVGISAARGTPQDLAIIEKILEAKESAFSKLDSRKETSQHLVDMTELSNKILSVSALKGHKNIVQYILARKNRTWFNSNSIDIDGIDWALENAMRVSHREIRHEIIHELYKQPDIKPSLSKTIDAIEIALDKINNSNYASTWFYILKYATTHNSYAIKNILQNTTLNMRSILVHKLVNRILDKKNNSTYPIHLVPDDESKTLAVIKFKKVGQIEIANKINETIQNNSPHLIDSAINELISHALKLCKNGKTKKLESKENENIKYNFIDDIFSLLQLPLNTPTNSQLLPKTISQIKELFVYMLINSSKFDRYQTNIDLLAKEYNMNFDQQTVLTKIGLEHENTLEPPSKRARGRPKKIDAEILEEEIGAISFIKREPFFTIIDCPES